MPPLRGTGTGPEAEDPEYAGQYRLEARLGSGGMGVVHLARSASGLPLAVKVVHADFAEDEEFRARFRQEVAAARRVSGAFTAPVVDADPDAVRPWMATLYIPGPTLSEHVKRNGPLAPAEIRRLAAGLAEALRDIHRAGVVHRDLKPGNVLLAEDGPKVIDFGISRPSDSDLRTETGKLIGTPPFMAPEQFQRPRSVGPAADVFALGSVLVHAATGRGPFDSDSPYIVAYQVVHDEANLAGVPEDLVPLIRSCLAKDPEGRPTPDAVMGMLRGLATVGRVPQPRRPGLVPETGAAHWPLPPEPETGGREGDGDGDGHRGDGRGDGNGRREDTGEGNGEGQPRQAVARRRTRRVRWIAVAAVVALVLGAGVAVAMRGNGSPRAAHGERKTVAAAPFRPWTTTLTPADGADSTARTPFCRYSAGALHCAAAGWKAARIDSGSGRRVWAREQSSAPADGALPAAPVPCGGLLHLMSSGGTRLEALDPASGGTRWSKDVSAYQGRVYHAGDTVLLVSGDGTVHGLHGATGRERWHRPVAGYSLPVFTSYGDGRTAYGVSTAGDGSRTRVSAIDPATGEPRWERGLSGTLAPVGTGRDGALLLTSTDREQRTDALVRYDPERRRERRIPLAFPLPSATAAVHGDTVHLLAYGGTLTAVDSRRAEGRSAELWRMETSVSNASPLTVTDDRLYFTAADGRLLAVDSRRGVLIGQTRPRMNPANRGYTADIPAPVAVGGRVFAGAPDGTLFGVEAGDPSRW
ncbi:protein kinase domain-containing protein [Streptomyces sp. 8N706]|uniref:protein kinase domain-containing protein n=1 Tax=Streptomyces sp. 8N706 TaxID=3457416 RepID=UPI003FD397A5